jgi:hypothetical protein
MFSTPFGRYRYLRLPFGISPAPEVFHRIRDGKERRNSEFYGGSGRIGAVGARNIGRGKVGTESSGAGWGGAESDPCSATGKNSDIHIFPLASGKCIALILGEKYDLGTRIFSFSTLSLASRNHSFYRTTVP